MQTTSSKLGSCNFLSERHGTLVIVVLFTCITGAACNDRDIPICTAEWVYGLHVEVRDAVTGDPAAKGAFILAREGSYVETFSIQNDLLALGAGERAGTYSLTISKPGYQPWQAQEIHVTSDECHVRPVVIKANLQHE